MIVSIFVKLMKKLTAYIILFCYLLMTTGIVAVSHYCMDRLASVSFFAATETKCGKCGMQKDKYGCCQDKATLIKVDTDHNKAPLTAYHLPAHHHLPVFTTEYLLTTLENGVYRNNDDDHPPPLPGNDIYLRNNVFRI